MLVLALDTCLARCAVCLFDSSKNLVLAKEHVDLERGHAEILAPMVQRVMMAADKKISDIERIAVTKGPGTFTGLRIGLSFARAFGLARNIPVIGIDTLQALHLSTDQTILALTSGNSGHAFVSRGAGIELVPLAQTQPEWFITGTPDLKDIAMWAAKQPVPAIMPEPVYIREPDAKPQVVVKQVGTEKAEALSAIHHAAFAHGWSKADLAAMLEVPGTKAFLAEVANEAAGFAIVRTITDQTELLTIATHPTRRRMGVAAKLLNAALQPTETFLEVAASNAAAYKLYVKLGFTEQGRRKAYYANGDDALLMKRGPV